jgi:hypothetical protein
MPENKIKVRTVTLKISMRENQQQHPAIWLAETVSIKDISIIAIA